MASSAELGGKMQLGGANIATGVVPPEVADVVCLVVQGVGGEMQSGRADIAAGVALPGVVDVVQTHV